jgi:serine/threonine protein kinase/Tol biopolymer transport system component
MEISPMIGTTVSHYKILEKLGEGGMGVVYKAHDTKLDRDVALKFLPHHVTATAEEQSRFLQEARAASALNHPNICGIHSIGDDGDKQFIEMEYVDGQTLRQMVPIQKAQAAIDYAIQIGEALHEAHSHGIVHRDIKTDNIMVNSKNLIKVMDFGLAKLKGSLKLTRKSSTVGTLAYMAPEQIQGGDVDARSDIFSFGVVLFEMLTGHLPFRGEHEAAMVYSIVNEAPLSIEKYMPEVSSELVHIINRVLEKDPEERYQSVHDLVIDLRRLRKETSRVARTSSLPNPPEDLPGMDYKLPGPPQFWSKKRLILLSFVLLFVCVVAAVFFLRNQSKLPKLNPEGRATRIPVTNISRYCSFSYDGNWIAFGAYDEQRGSDVYYMNSSGGAVRRVTHDATGEVIPGGCSRDGAWILYTRLVGRYQEIALVPTLGGPVRVIARGYAPRFSPLGETIYYVRGFEYTEPSESGKIEVCSIGLDGSNKRVVFVDPGYTREAGRITYSMSVSPDGKFLAWIKTFPDFSQDIITYDIETKAETQVTYSRTLKDEVYWTYDNNLIFSSYTNGNFELWICPADGGAPLQLTRSRNDEMYGALCNDGSKLLYYEQSISGNIKSMDIKTGKVTSLTSDDQVRYALSISPDGRYAAYMAASSYTNWRTRMGIQILDTRGEYPLRTINAQERSVGNKRWSPDGKWIAFTRPPDSVGGTIKVCIVSAFDGMPSRVVGEAKGAPDQSLSLWWVNADSLSWFSEMKTWICALRDARTTQFFEDSTRVRVIKDGKFVMYYDYRSGRQNWWISEWRVSTKGERRASRKMLDVGIVAIAPSAEFCLCQTKRGSELIRISLPEGKAERLPFGLPLLAESGEITQDGKAMVYVEGTFSSRLMLWENPFIKE